MVNGYAGNLLRVFLDEKKAKEEKLNFDDMKKYIGGVGYGAKLLYDELKERIDPLGPNNKIVFATSPLTMNTVPGGGSIELCFKSPLTGAWGESRCGGDFGPEMRKAGYDFIIIEGKADQPVYLVINDGKVSIKFADHLKGKTVTEKIEEIKNDLSDSNFKVMCIGQGGENLVKYATVMFGGRAAGRCGAGAVMGSKNLIAIAVKGSGKLKPALPEKYNTVLKTMHLVLKNSDIAKGFREFGTMGDMAGNDAAGDWPTKNWQANSWGKGQILYDHYEKHNFIKNEMCYKGCPIACGRIAQVKEGPFKTPQHSGAEYESLSAFTAFVLNENIDAAVHSSYLCNEYGIDTISTGAVIAFAMECYENGLISQEDAEGLELTWGNSDILPLLVEKISKREGIGELLAEGVLKAAKKIGKNAEKFAIHCKGLEGAAHDPRSGKALAVTYGTANRGMCHIHPLEGMAYDSGKNDFGMIPYGVPDPNRLNRWDEKGKGKIVKILQDGLVMPDVLCVCKFFMYTGITLEHYAQLMSGITGWQLEGKDLLRIGERVINLQRLFNQREGFAKKDDELTDRAKQRPLFGIYHDEDRCIIKDYEEMLQEYYEARGWDHKTGIPKKEKLLELGLQDK
jgi:aldehyde:ferredoxin oxidoreductase